MNRKQKKRLVRIIITTVMLLIAPILSQNVILKSAWYLTAYFLIGYDVLRKSFRKILHGVVFDENFLMSIATIGAMILKDFKEAVAVLLFYQIGEFFQSYAVGKSRRNITALMDINPEYANLETKDGVIRTNPQEILVGSMIIVKPGEKVPIDGVIEEGDSYIDTSALTGESVPRRVCVGEEILSGCINQKNVLRIKTKKEFKDSTVSKILELVENAGEKKSKSEKFITKFAKYYTPVVCFLALALAVIPPLILFLLPGFEPEIKVWIYRALTFLVISCPCALVISIPLTFFAGIGGAGKAGVLIKGANYLETLAKTKYMVFDKTGTLTEGVFEVIGVHHNTQEEELILEYAAYVEYFSTHPISTSLKKAYGKHIDASKIKNVKEIPGQGISALVDGKMVAAGNDKLMKRLGIAFIPCHHVGTIVHLAVEQEYMGHILISDKVKSTSKESLQRLKKEGMKKIVLLTGDKKNVSEALGRELEIDEVYSELLPKDKVEQVEHLLKHKKQREMLAFVGDGMNDAPVLSRADIGIAMGAMGSDAAIEAADIVLMDDDPIKIVKAVKIARKCMNIVYQNIYFCIMIKICFLILGAVGIANMWYAIFADVGVLILAVLNAMRTLAIKSC